MGTPWWQGDTVVARGHRQGSSRNFFPWRRNLRAGGLFFHIRHPFAFLPLGGDPVFALTCVQAHRHSQHPSTHKHTRWLCSWYRGITFRTFMGEDEFKTSQTLPPSRLPCPFPSELLLLLVWWHPEGLQSRRGSPRIALGVAKASGQDAKRTGAREGQVQEIIFFSGMGPDPIPSQPVCDAGRALLAPGEVLQALSGAREGSVGYRAALGRAARASRRLGRGWIKAKRGSEVSQLLLHVSKRKRRRRRRANRETRISRSPFSVQHTVIRQPKSNAFLPAQSRPWSLFQCMASLI